MLTQIAALVAALVIASTVQTAAAGTIDDAIAAYDRGDYETAVAHFRVEAELGNAGAQLGLGVMSPLVQGCRHEHAPVVDDGWGLMISARIGRKGPDRDE